MIRASNKNISILFYFSAIIVSIFLLIYFFYYKKEEDQKFHTINFKLITSTHTELPWEFSPLKPTIKIKVGEVTNVEYFVKNLSNKKTSGIASFAYHPKELNKYISKIQCFCYETKTLMPGEKQTYTLTMMIDPKVTKDSKTKSIKEVIMQFVFFDSKNYLKKN